MEGGERGLEKKIILVNQFISYYEKSLQRIKLTKLTERVPLRCLICIPNASDLVPLRLRVTSSWSKIKVKCYWYPIKIDLTCKNNTDIQPGTLPFISETTWQFKESKNALLYLANLKSTRIRKTYFAYPHRWTQLPHETEWIALIICALSW